ncbi:ebony [Carabus blaptoides fortunei]
MGSLPNVSVLKEVAHGQAKDAAAMIYEDGNQVKKTSYEELDRITNKLARAIIHSVTEAKTIPNADGDYIIAVSMLPSDKLVKALLAIWKSGAAYLPIDPSFPNDRVEHILKESAPVLVLHEHDFNFGHMVPTNTFENLLDECENFSDNSLDLEEYLKHEKDNLAIVLYTSGSTGIPKGVRIPHEVILNRLQWQFNTFPYSNSETVCVFKTALTFVDSVSEVWGPLLNGLAILVIPKKITQDPEKLVDLLQLYKIERLVLVPSLLRSLLLFLDLQKDDTLLRNLRIWVCSGEPLSVSLAQEFFHYFPENNHMLCNFYGSTEIMGDVTYHVISGLAQLKNQEKVPIGLPIDNTIIYLLDQELRPVETGAVGELWVSGLNLAAGYVNGRDPERFIPNPLHSMNHQFGKLYKTGDYARIEKGTILYEGRTDSQVKIRGHRVDLSEVEKAVTSVPYIEKGVVLCYHAGEIDQALLAFVTLKNNCLTNELQIENILHKKLASYMQPQVIIMEHIPLLVNGKIDRQSLLKNYENTNNNDDSCVQVDIDYSGVAEHQMQAAKVLLETVASVLNRSARGAVCIDANFYDIGGNSLNSIFTITKLNEQGYYISIGDFISAVDLREILNHMSPEKHILPTKALETPKYTAEMLNSEHKSDVFKMITDSFYEKADLEQWLMPDIYRDDYAELLEKIWQILIDKELSFVARTENGRAVGVALNFDARDEPEVEINSKLSVIFEFLEYVEGPVRDESLPSGKGKIFHSSMMATSSSLSAKDNVSVMQYMEEEVLRIARSKNYAGIFTTNTSPLTQQLGTDVYGYQVMSDCQVNQYVASDGSKPFVNLSSNFIGIDNRPLVMETDFLNFHDEEHFGTGLYQSDLLDDSQSSLLDIVGDDYSRQDSTEYIDHSVIWEQDVERELNGDMAVIPMSGQIDSFPKLSNSPPSKDFQKIFSDWQHLTAIEAAPAEDITVDLHMPNQSLAVDILDCFTPAPITATVPAQTEAYVSSTSTSHVSPSKIEVAQIKIEPVTEVPSFDLSTTVIKVEAAFESESKFKKKDPKPPLRKTGGKNLELLKQVVKEDIDLNTSFKSEINSSDELDSLTDNFDITSYVNGDDDMLQMTQTKFDPKSSLVKNEKKVTYARKFGGCYEKNMPDSEEEEIVTAKEEIQVEKKVKCEERRRSLHEDSEEDCIDVETVETEQMPVLQARDLTSLLEQFEASEAVNPKLPQTLFEEKPAAVDHEKSTLLSKPGMVKQEPSSNCQQLDAKITTETKSTSLENSTKCKQIIGELKPKKSLNLEPRNGKHMNKNIRDSLPLELIQKIKASGTKKSISVIPAMPSKKSRTGRVHDTQLNRNKILKRVAPSCPTNESYQLDHDYCSPARMPQPSPPVQPSTLVQPSPRRNSSDTDNSCVAKKFSSPNHSFSLGKKELKCDRNVEYLMTQKLSTVESSDMLNDEVNKVKKTVANLIDDTAIRIGKQIKNAINNENAVLKQKMLRQDSLLKNQPTVKSADGKLMVSLLKANSRNNVSMISKMNGNTIVNTVNTNDEQIQNIIVTEEEVKRNAKKRKLNLEEYKKLRGDIIKTPSCESSPGNSGANSPMPAQNDKEKVIEEKYQEMMSKMASEILKTNAKSRPTSCDATLEEFVPPNVQKVVKVEEKVDEKPPKTIDYEIKTIVSIGVNTDESFLRSQQSKIAFKVNKQRDLQKKKSSESENCSPKKLSEMITPILQNASMKINSHSLITNITATLLQQSPKVSHKQEATVKLENASDKMDSVLVKEEAAEHGEDKTVIILNKNLEKPAVKCIGIQTDIEAADEKPTRQYCSRRDSSASSSASVTSVKSKTARKGSSIRKQSHRIGSSNSVSSSLGSRWSRSRSRSRSRSTSVYSNSSYSSDSSRSKSRSVSPSRRWHTNRNRYSRSRRRSRSNSYRGNYRRSRSPYSRSRSQRRRERESAERERVREVEERRVIYVGKISDDTTKADLRRRFQNFGPITNVSVHFRDHGDNYGFVTFAYKVDAYEAVERGNNDPNCPKYDISFGGRRAFCKTRYSDLDKIEDESMNPAPIFRRDEDSFDILLREVQAKLRKRKV